MNDRSSITALMSAFARAYHTRCEQRPIFTDDIAEKLMSAEEYQQISQYVSSGIDFFAPEKKNEIHSRDEILKYIVRTQLAPTPAARARFCEDSLKTAVMTGVKQYVILGAGLDTFAFREPDFVSRHHVFEVDHPLTLADKRERIARAGLSVPEKQHYVPVDFSCDDLSSKLLDSGFDPKKKTFFSWLGVSYYLTVEQIASILDSLAGISAEGSTLVFDCADEDLFTSDIKRVQNMAAMAAAGGEPMRSCFSYLELEKLLEEHGFLIYEYLTPEDIQQQFFEEQYGNMTAFEHIDYVTAVHKL